MHWPPTALSFILIAFYSSVHAGESLTISEEPIVVESISELGELDVFTDWPSDSCLVNNQQRKPSIGEGQIALYPQQRLTETTTKFMFSYIDFLDRYLADSALLAQSIVKCQSLSSPTPDCEPINRYVNEYLAHVLRVARFNLALAGDGNLLDINRDLKSPFSANKQIPWAPLETRAECPDDSKKTDCRSEIETANIQNQNYKNRLFRKNGLIGRAAAQRRAKARNTLKNLREKHEKVYLNVMSQFPILQYLSGPKPSPKAVVNAANKTLANNAKERTVLAEMKKQILSRQPRQTFNHSYLSTLTYRPFLDAFLWGHPEYCNLATDLLKITQRRNLIGNTMLMSFFIGTGFIGQLTKALATSVSLTGAVWTNAKSNLDQTKTRNFSVVQSAFELEDGTQNLGYSINSVNQAKTDLIMETAMAPFAFISGGLSRAMILKAIRKEKAAPN